MIKTTQGALRRIGRARMGGNPVAIQRNVMTSPLRVDDTSVNAQLLYDTPAKQVMPIARGQAFIPPSAMKTSPVTTSNGATFISPDVFNEVPQYGPAVSIAPPSSRGPLQRRARVPGRVTSPATPPAPRRDIALRNTSTRPTAPGIVDPGNPDTVLSKYVGLGDTSTTVSPAVPNVGTTPAPVSAGLLSSPLFAGLAASPVNLFGYNIDTSWLWAGAGAVALLALGGRR